MGHGVLESLGNNTLLLLGGAYGIDQYDINNDSCLLKCNNCEVHCYSQGCEGSSGTLAFMGTINNCL